MEGKYVSKHFVIVTLGRHVIYTIHTSIHKDCNILPIICFEFGNYWYDEFRHLRVYSYHYCEWILLNNGSIARVTITIDRSGTSKRSHCC